MSKKMSKVLITGGAGFIGSFIARNLLSKGHEVIIYDMFIQYVMPFESNYQVCLEKRFEGIWDKIVFIRGDTRNKDHLRRCIYEHKPEKIIHMANIPISDMSNLNPEEAIGCIINGTVNVLDVMRESLFVDRLVYASSSMVYGDFQYTPADEDHPKAPKDIYGGAKLATEILIQAYQRRFGINYTIVRPSAVYGPTDLNRRVTQIFIEDALKGKPIKVMGGEDFKVDFTHVKDLAEGIVLATFHEKAVNEVFNITAGRGRSLLEYIQIVKVYIPTINYEVVPPDPKRPKRGALDISKAQRLLGFKPKYSIEDGIPEYIEFLKNTIIRTKE